MLILKQSKKTGRRYFEFPFAQHFANGMVVEFQHYGLRYLDTEQLRDSLYDNGGKWITELSVTKLEKVRESTATVRKSALQQLRESFGQQKILGDDNVWNRENHSWGK